MVVYSLKNIYLYKGSLFTNKGRKAFYINKPRVNRPMFVVQHSVVNKNGRVRYFVRDVNHHSKTYGWRGYITANKAFVRGVYYQNKPQVITVINPNGVNEYTAKNLTGKVKHIKQGTKILVSKEAGTLVPPIKENQV